MTIASEITRLQWAKADIKTAIETKWVPVPSNAKFDTYDEYILQIPTWEWLINWLTLANRQISGRDSSPRIYWIASFEEWWKYYWCNLYMWYNRSSNVDYFSIYYYIKQSWSDVAYYQYETAWVSDNTYWNINRYWYYKKDSWTEVMAIYILLNSRLNYECYSFQWDYLNNSITHKSWWTLSEYSSLADFWIDLSWYTALWSSWIDRAVGNEIWNNEYIYLVLK